jgi:hypothetical protein
MCNFYGHKVSKIQFIRLKQIEKELGTIAALKELETFKDGFTYSNSVIVKTILKLYKPSGSLHPYG